MTVMKFQIARDSDMRVEIDVEVLAKVLSPVARWATVTGKLIYRANRDLTTIDMNHVPPPGYELVGPVGLGNAYIGPWRYFLNDVEISEADYLAIEKAVKAVLP